MSDTIWYRDKGKLRLGQVCRYVLSYRKLSEEAAVESEEVDNTTEKSSITSLTHEQEERKRIYLRIKNTEKSSLRAVHFFNGPYVFYFHVVPHNYNHRKEFTPDNDIKSNEIVFKNEVKPGQTVNVELFCNKNSFVRKDDDGWDIFQWSVDIVSQILVSRHVLVEYDLLLGSDSKILKKINHGPLNGTSNNLFKNSSSKTFNSEKSKADEINSYNSSAWSLNDLKYSFTSDGSTTSLNDLGSTLNDLSKPLDLVNIHSHHNRHHLHNLPEYLSQREHKLLLYTFVESQNDDEIPMNQSLNPQISVERLTGNDIWNSTPKDPTKPVHLIIITHGIFSNVQADMLYVKEAIENNVQLENCIVRGFVGNAGRSEKGIKKLGVGVGDFVVQTLDQLSSRYTVDKISFIGHSLGGVVQLFGIKHILVTKGDDFFSKRNITPQHLVGMATPFLGVLSEMSVLISWFLDIGALGKTGRDMTLSRKIPTFKDLTIKNLETRKDNFKPVLEMLPEDPLHKFLTQFKHLTLYANAVNDGIVPLRTSSLLYLDWEALGKVGDIQKREHEGDSSTDEEGPIDPDDENDIETVNSGINDTVGEVPEDEKDVEELGEMKAKRSKEIKTQNPVVDTLQRATTTPFGGLFNKNGLSRREAKFMLALTEGMDAEELEKQLKADSDEGRGQSKVNGSEKAEEDQSNKVNSATEINIPPKASAVESALNTLMFPVPSSKFVLSPSERNGVIFHDKYYQLKNLDTKPDSKKKQLWGEYLFGKGADERIPKQVRIANKYHRDLTWRKVLVHLPPDAHNNMIVRRRFSNAYGWGVVDHLTHLFDDKVGPKI